MAKCGVEIPDYDGLKTVYPETEHLGRKHIADWMYKNGMVDSVDSAPFRSGYGGLETLGEIRKAGSDYHGQSETDGLDNHFPMEIWEKIEENYRRYFKEN